jgi:hypothetical protein
MYLKKFEYIQQIEEIAEVKMTEGMGEIFQDIILKNLIIKVD